MAQVNLGRIGFVNKGSWNIATNYKLNDVVKYGGSTYAAKRPNAGVTPPTNGTDTDDWFYFVNNNDYVDKTSNQDITGIKNFTASPKVPEPTGNNDAVNKVYVDDKTIINSFTDKPTPDDTDNFALQEAGGLLKKLSFSNLMTWIKSFSFGWGQTFQTFTVGTQRIAGMTYTNTSGKPIGIYIQGSGAGASGWSITLTINGTEVLSISHTANGGESMNISGIVPNGATYIVAKSGGNISRWVELR